MKIECVIVDDDAFSREELKRLLHANSNLQLEILAEFSEASSAILFIKEHQPHLIFLDIQMPGISGFEMLDHLDSNLFEVVFITSHNEYAIRAIKYSALDYLLKPIDPTELAQTIQRFKLRKEKGSTSLKFANLRLNLQAENQQGFHLVIPTKQGEFQFAASDIIRCEADSNYTAIHLVHKRTFLASKTLSDIEEMLSTENFLRIHKSHLINLAHVLHLTALDEIMMSDQLAVPVSKRRLHDVKAVIRKLSQ